VKKHLNLWLSLLLIVFGLSYWLGAKLLPSPVSELATGSVLTPLAPVAVGETVSVVILNGTDIKGLAQQFRRRLEWAGWQTERIGNTPDESRYEHSFLINRRLPFATATGLGRDLGGLPILQEYDQRTVGDLVLVLGRDYSRLAELLPLPARP